MRTKRVGAGLIIKLLVLFVAVIAAINLLQLQAQINSMKKDVAQLGEQAAEQSKKNTRLNADLETEIDDEYIANIARDKLGLIKPGERIFVDISN